MARFFISSFLPRFQPLFFQPFAHLVMQSIEYLESESTCTVLPCAICDAAKRKATNKPFNSAELLVPFASYKPYHNCASLSFS